MLSLDLATPHQNKKESCAKKNRTLKFNDTIEVYFYPENKAQHGTPENSDDEEEPIQIDYPRLAEADDDEVAQELVDPTFEEMLHTYISR